MPGHGHWTREQLTLAFHLYCQLPFGRLHSKNPEIIALATCIGRTPAALAMKLVNFASLDPAIRSTGRSGLGNASVADRSIWDEFHQDWDRLALESRSLLAAMGGKPEDAPQMREEEVSYDVVADYAGETRSAILQARIKQGFFRRAVLSSYTERCCMSGISEPRLLVASHIVPWSVDKANRLNPRNGLCLSALHDRAYDTGLITVTPDFVVRVSKALKRKRSDSPLRDHLLGLDGMPIELPHRFRPEPEFLKWHCQRYAD